MQPLERFSIALNKLCTVIAGMAVIALMLVATVNVIARMLGLQVPGAYEIAGFCGALTIAMALGRTQQRKENVTVDIISQYFPKTVHRVLDAIQFLLTGCFFLFVGWNLIGWANTLRHTGEVSETLKIIYYPFVYCVVLGFAALTLTLLLDFVAAITRPTERKLP